MSKEIENKECSCCESSYKLIYQLDLTSGFPKFCPFCGSDIYDDDEIKIEKDEDE